MSFDPRSLERLRQLGRSLPQPLPAPEPPARARRPQPAQHRVETEQNPEQLFRELMQASADGSVPPHLLDRLRELEGRRQPGSADGTAGAAAAQRSVPSRQRAPRQRRSAAPAATADSDLYTAFQQLLLEEEEDA